MPKAAQCAAPSPPNLHTARMSLCIQAASRALTTNQPAVVGTPSCIVASSIWAPPQRLSFGDLHNVGYARRDRIGRKGGRGNYPIICRPGIMANVASQALGAPEVAGALVSPKGLTKKMSMGTAGGQVGGLEGNLAASALASKTAKKTPDMPSFGRSGYLAASETELVLT